MMRRQALTDYFGRSIATWRPPNRWNHGIVPFSGYTIRVYCSQFGSNRILQGIDTRQDVKVGTDELLDSDI